MAEVASIHLPAQVLVFRVGDTVYVLDIHAVDEVLGPLAVTPLPAAPDGVAGVVEVRGHIVPVFDLRWKFGLGRRIGATDSRQILVDSSEGLVSLLVDDVEDVMTPRREDFQALATPGDPSGLRHITAILRHETRLILVVDHRRLLPTGLRRAVSAA